MDYSLIVKTTNNCNLNCSYCYYRHEISRDHPQFISHDTIELLIKNLLEHNEYSAEFIWHGGEPLLAGLDTFRFIIEKQNEYNVKGLKIRNSVQTNGTLLNDDYISFFEEHNIHIGISLDGPFDMHASQRKTSESQYEKILKSLKILNSSKGEYGVLCVVGKQHIGQAQRIFDLFKEYGIKQIGFLPCLVHENGVVNEELTISPNEYADFLINFFEIWINSDVHGICVRNFDDCIRFYRKKPTRNCINNCDCDQYITLMPNGNMYLCDNFSANEEYYIGQISDGFENIAAAKPMVWLKKSMQYTPDECTLCPYFNGCKSGCKYRRWVRSSDMKQGHYYCYGTKKFYAHVGKYFSQGDTK